MVNLKGKRQNDRTKEKLGYEENGIRKAKESEGIICEPTEEELLAQEQLESEWEVSEEESVEHDFTEDSVRSYLKEIGEISCLTREEELTEGWKLYYGRQAERKIAELECGTEAYRKARKAIEEAKLAQKRFIEANAKLVVSIVKHYTGHGVDMLDLIQEGNIGLMCAVDHYDVSKGFRFSTYATWWIRQAMLRGIANMGRVIRIPVHMNEAKMKMKRVMEQMENRLGREVSYAELQQELGYSDKKMKEVWDTLSETASLDAEVGEERETSLMELTPNDRQKSPEETCIRSACVEEIGNVLQRLDEREREILTLRYGLEDTVPLTLEEIGEHFGITRERVRQLEERAIGKIRRSPSAMATLRDFWNAAQAS